MNILEIIKEEVRSISSVINEDYNHSNYLKWKRQNVTLRGIRDNNSPDNNVSSK